MSILILELFGLAEVHGAPRVGLRKYGVPPGGAFDQESLMLGNALLQNATQAPAIELSNAAMRFTTLEERVVSVVGAPVEIIIDGRSAIGQASVSLRAGSEVLVSAPKSGLRCYLCLPGGVQGGLARRLSRGDVVQAVGTRTDVKEMRFVDPPGSLSKGPLRLLTGPQEVAMDSTQSYAVSAMSDRVGVRLDGGLGSHAPELVSEPACFGAVQLTPSGQLIVLGPDGPTIGGYPKPAVVCSADLDRLAHLRPGDEATFEWIEPADANELAEKRRARITNRLSGILAARGE